MEPMELDTALFNQGAIADESGPTPEDTQKDPNYELLHAKTLVLGETEHDQDLFPKDDVVKDSTEQVPPPLPDKARLCY